MELNQPLVGITLGDPVGIGPEIIPKTLIDPRVLRCCRPVVFGNADCLYAGATVAGAHIDFSPVTSIDEVRREHKGVPVIDCNTLDAGQLAWPKPTAACGVAMAGRVAAIAKGSVLSK